jgi:hypothetical protein
VAAYYALNAAALIALVIAHAPGFRGRRHRTPKRNNTSYRDEKTTAKRESNFAIGFLLVSSKKDDERVRANRPGRCDGHHKLWFCGRNTCLPCHVRHAYPSPRRLCALLRSSRPSHEAVGDSIALAELLELGDGRYVAIVLVVQQQQTAVAFVNTLLVPVRVPFTDAVNELFAMPQQFVQQELFDLMDAADLMTLLRSASSLAVDGTIDRAAVGIKGCRRARRGPSLPQPQPDQALAERPVPPRRRAQKLRGLS